MIELLIKGGLSYAIGSVVASLVIGHMRGIDIRTLGSGNAGATNAMRTLGARLALVVFVIDLAKGWIATGAIAPWAVPAPWAAPAAVSPWSVPVCALAVMLGHVYPLWYGFRGGKGMATLLGVVLAVNAWLTLPMILVWLATVILTGFVGLGSILATVALAVALATGRSGAPLVTFGILAALLIAFTHRANIARMRAGTEARARRLWLFGTRRGQA
jgi:acyl phosphate:glycerol-3-phosphate acyltransferase